LGFSCASLGSRISEAQGRRALAGAFEREVTWFDVAPAYGDGEAETILGRFLLGRRDRVVISTKYGRPAPTIAPAARLLRPILRGLSKVFPHQFADVILAKPQSSKNPLRADMIEGSVVESLRRLRTDYVDVLALDDPSPEEAADEAILRALQHIVEKGYARAISIAGAPEAIVAGARATTLIGVAQFLDSPFQQAAELLCAALAGDASLFFATHGIFGGGVFERILRLLGSDGGRLAALASQLGYGPPFLASELLLDYAFSNNPEGVVLVSMRNQAHIELNSARASNPPRSDVVPFVRKYFVEGQP
jgi:aryl-alcohol dehydrogenase-like predicted oxidoreductase